jgi:hypothetical protein
MRNFGCQALILRKVKARRICPRPRIRARYDGRFGALENDDGHKFEFSGLIVVLLGLVNCGSD